MHTLLYSLFGKVHLLMSISLHPVPFTQRYLHPCVEGHGFDSCLRQYWFMKINGIMNKMLCNTSNGKNWLSAILQTTVFCQYIWLFSCYFMCNVYFIQRCTMFWHIKNESKNNSQTLPNSLNFQTEYKNVAFDISEWKRMFRRSAY